MGNWNPTPAETLQAEYEKSCKPGFVRGLERQAASRVENSIPKSQSAVTKLATTVECIVAVRSSTQEILKMLRRNLENPIRSAQISRASSDLFVEKCMLDFSLMVETNFPRSGSQRPFDKAINLSYTCDTGEFLNGIFFEGRFYLQADPLPTEEERSQPLDMSSQTMCLFLVAHCRVMQVQSPAVADLFSSELRIKLQQFLEDRIRNDEPEASFEELRVMLESETTPTPCTDKNPTAESLQNELRTLYTELKQ